MARPEGGQEVTTDGEEISFTEQIGDLASMWAGVGFSSDTGSSARNGIIGLLASELRNASGDETEVNNILRVARAALTSRPLNMNYSSYAELLEEVIIQALGRRR